MKVTKMKTNIVTKVPKNSMRTNIQWIMADSGSPSDVSYPISYFICRIFAREFSYTIKKITFSVIWNIIRPIRLLKKRSSLVARFNVSTRKIVKPMKTQINSSSVTFIQTCSSFEKFVFTVYIFIIKFKKKRQIMNKISKASVLKSHCLKLILLRR